uniref:DNA helicase MCM9 n=2 Tax=Lygus hesperus TaxID=30085 RepID=A0A0A9XC16_LYGHE
MGRSRLNEEPGACEEFVDYAVLHHKSELERILEAGDVNGHYSISVNFVTLFETCTTLGDGILSQPTALLPLCDKALIEAQKKVKEQLKLCTLVVKVNVHARISALPVCPELYKSVFPRNEDLGSFLRISGTVVRRTMPKMLEFKKTYLCQKCKYTFVLFAEYEKHYAIQPVGSCRNPETCKSTNVVSVSNPDDFKDYQELKIQEQVGKLDMGSIPKSMLVTVEDDLVDACKPGDDVVICGTVRRRWKNFMTGLRPEVDLVLQANSLEVSNGQNNNSLVTQELMEEFKGFWKTHAHRPMIGRNFILQCVGPEVYGLYLIKLAIALVLSGGVAQQPGTGARVRGESHLLLVGDPGTAKSQLLRFAAAVSPRSVFTTGIGSTSAGLTVSAAMGAGGEWQLEAGALVLADGGICCIDEFNSIRESERASIHEAMEQQTLSVAKAGMVCKLSTVCSILAATNPKGQFDTAHPITVNCAIASPLLSRFDLVFVLLDRKNKDWDSLISSYVLQEKTLCKSSTSELWSVEKLQAYFSIVKSLQPQLSEDASTILKEYYRVQRRNVLTNASRITVRLLESLVRLAQAHAKFMFRREVTVRDAVVSVSLMEASHQASSIDAFMSNPIQTTFPVDPEEEYIDTAQKVLGSLGLQRLLDIEIASYMNGHGSNPNDLLYGSTLKPQEPVDGLSQLAATKSDLNKKLDIVFNNIRQNKLREENKALAFQQEAGKKRKKRSGRGKKRESLTKGESVPTESDGSSSDGSSKPSNPKTSKKVKSDQCNRKRSVFAICDSGSESDFGCISPVKSTPKVDRKPKKNSNKSDKVGISNNENVEASCSGVREQCELRAEGVRTTMNASDTNPSSPSIKFLQDRQHV